MSQNSDIVRQVVEAFNERDFHRAERLYARDYVNHNPRGLEPAQARADA